MFKYLANWSKALCFIVLLSFSSLGFAVDSDGDGHSDDDELDWGSDPLDANSVPMAGLSLNLIKAFVDTRDDEKLLQRRTWPKTYTPNLAGYSSTITHGFDRPDSTLIFFPITETYEITNYGFARSIIDCTHPPYEYADTNPPDSYLQ